METRRPSSWIWIIEPSCQKKIDMWDVQTPPQELTSLSNLSYTPMRASEACRTLTILIDVTICSRNEAGEAMSLA